jgi:uncharacterized protein YabN with tetrapyrrole methylase and pyrophosphatase domain
VGPGSLTVVGTGIQVGSQTTAEAKAAIQHAEEVLYLVTDSVASAWIESLNQNTRSLEALYRPGEHRTESYERIVEEISRCVRSGVDVCVAFYGHPGVLVRPAQEAVRRVRSDGFRARMLPGVSAEDCLFADLGVDPGQGGCQTYEATDFLIRRRTPDSTAALILWQISVLGIVHAAVAPDTSKLPILVEYLLRFYSAGHEVVLYEASPYVVCGPLVEHVALSELPAAEIAPMTTLYVPPIGARPVDQEVADRLGMPRL